MKYFDLMILFFSFKLKDTTGLVFAKYFFLISFNAISLTLAATLRDSFSCFSSLIVFFKLGIIKIVFLI